MNALAKNLIESPEALDPTWIIYWPNGEVSYETEPPGNGFTGRHSGPFQGAAAAREELTRLGYREIPDDACYFEKTI